MYTVGACSKRNPTNPCKRMSSSSGTILTRRILGGSNVQISGLPRGLPRGHKTLKTRLPTFPTSVNPFVPVQLQFRVPICGTLLPICGLTERIMLCQPLRTTGSDLPSAPAEVWQYSFRLRVLVVGSYQPTAICVLA